MARYWTIQTKNAPYQLSLGRHTLYASIEASPEPVGGKTECYKRQHRTGLLRDALRLQRVQGIEAQATVRGRATSKAAVASIIGFLAGICRTNQGRCSARNCDTKVLGMISLDLDLLLARVSGHSARMKLRKLVEQFELFSWAETDLLLAEQTLNCIRDRACERQTGPMSAEDSLIDGALAARAFLLYAEATARADPHAIMNANQRERHREIRDIRRKVIAHRDAHDHPTGSWFSADTSMDIDKAEFKINFHWRRSNYRGAALADMVTLIGIIRPYYADKANAVRVVIMDNVAVMIEEGTLIITDSVAIECLIDKRPSGVGYVQRVHILEDGLVRNDLKTGTDDPAFQDN